MRRLLPALTLTLTLSPALADTAAGLPELMPPPLPGAVPEDMEPEVTIRRQGGGVIEEYRINGQLYMVKIIPAKGPAYYLMDTNGDGELESRRGELDPRLLVPNWAIFRW
jgi:hypothetical protein